MQRPEVYHLALSEDALQGARYALLPGDPFRSTRIAEIMAERYNTPKPDHPLAHKRETAYPVDSADPDMLWLRSTGGLRPWPDLIFRTPMAAFQSLLGLTTQHAPTTHKMLYVAESTG